MLYRPGQAVVHHAQPSWGVGKVLDVLEDPPRLYVRFPGRVEGPTWISSRDPEVERHRFGAAEAVLVDGEPARVLEFVGERQGKLRYRIERAGKPQLVSEERLSAPAPAPSPERMLA